MSDIYKEFGVDFLCARHAGPTAAEVRMEREITRLRAEVQELASLLNMSGYREAKLRARVEVLEKALGHYAKDYLMGYCARAALEAKP